MSATANSSSRLQRYARRLGCPELIELDCGEEGSTAARVDQLDYFELLPGRYPSQLPPSAVAEFQGRPVVYFVDALDENGAASIRREQVDDLRALLANRSEHACLAVARPGELEVHAVHLDRRRLATDEPVIVRVADPEAPLFFQSLATGQRPIPGQPKEADYVFRHINQLLDHATKELHGPGMLKPAEILSVAGRALFFRFLHDRGIVRKPELRQICPDAPDLNAVFNRAEWAAETSAWLDETFNGDLLPLAAGVDCETAGDERRRRYLSYYRDAGRRTGGKVFTHLQAVLSGWERAAPGEFQTLLTDLGGIDWSDLNFAHVPVGVLSQVYENFSHWIDTAQSLARSVHYTPVKVARIMVAQSFTGLTKAEQARILDPACGAGVFLVLSFRELVRARWAAEGRRPDKKVIHEILYQQLRGYDVSGSALRLAALALYITAIELNPTDRPARLLRHLEPLTGTVLKNVEAAGGDNIGIRGGFVLGSLAAGVGDGERGSFDLVIGNPPWTRLRPSAKASQEEKRREGERIKRHAAMFTEIGREVLRARGMESDAKSYANPDNNPDIPFLWRAIQWAKPGGVIAMALSSRLIHKQNGPGKTARDLLLRSLAVTGIVNGSDLEQTPVWPGIKVPFLLLFARNAKPAPDHAFHFVTPLREEEMAKRGEFRLDYKSAQTVAVADSVKRPWLFKVLAIGTVLDVEVVERIRACPYDPLGETWTRAGLHHGKGYNLGAEAESENDEEELEDVGASAGGEPKKCPDWFGRLRLFSEPKQDQLFDETSVTFAEKYPGRAPISPRRKEIYQAPLLVVKKAVLEDADASQSFRFPNQARAYNNSYYGYSAAGHPEGEAWVALLHLVRASRLFRFWLLMTSAEFGVNYSTFLKDEIDTFPFPDVSALPAATRRRILALAEALDAGRARAREQVDAFIFQLYALSPEDGVVICETVDFQSPFTSCRVVADAAPKEPEVLAFAQGLRDYVAPFLDEGEAARLSVEALPSPVTEQWTQPWRFLYITQTGSGVGSQHSPIEFTRWIVRLMAEADKTAASRVTLRLRGALLIGLLNRRRHWTLSRAELCGREIVRRHLDVFPEA
jgi:hypothetical protein